LIFYHFIHQLLNFIQHLKISISYFFFLFYLKSLISFLGFHLLLNFNWNLLLNFNWNLLLNFNWITDSLHLHLHLQDFHLLNYLHILILPLLHSYLHFHSESTIHCFPHPNFHYHHLAKINLSLSLHFFAHQNPLYFKINDFQIFYRSLIFNYSYFLHL